MVLMMKNFDILGAHWKIWLLGGRGFMKKRYGVGDSLQRGIGQFADLRGRELGKKDGDSVF